MTAPANSPMKFYSVRWSTTQSNVRVAEPTASASIISPE